MARCVKTTLGSSMNALEGLRVVNTRSISYAGELNDLLRDRGAIALSYPCVAIEPVSKFAEFDNALRNDSFNWICLTSPSAVKILASRANQLGIDRARLTLPRYAVFGAAVADSLKKHLGIDADFASDTYGAESMTRDCPIERGDRVLMPVSDLATPELDGFLAEKGAEAVRIVVYRTVVGKGGVDVGTLLKDGHVDAIIFTSPWAVSGFVKRLKKEEGNLDDARQVPIACMSPHTRNRAISENMLRAFSPTELTLHGLLDALNDTVVLRRHTGRLWG
ncbi:MAG: uroporphyrinogen-III synthase [Thermomicrobiales bacterium]|nr:MAG: uroporphyrinogen-III synthase [Thermomicrobiales bacterium]